MSLGIVQFVGSRTFRRSLVVALTFLVSAAVVQVASAQTGDGIKKQLRQTALDSSYTAFENAYLAYSYEGALSGYTTHEYAWTYAYYAYYYAAIARYYNQPKLFNGAQYYAKASAELSDTLLLFGLGGTYTYYARNSAAEAAGYCYSAFISGKF